MPADAAQGSAEAARKARNELAWSSCSGYETSSGSPCWDASRYPCIPKSLGWGWNPNFYALCCCFLCDTSLAAAGADAGQQPPATGAGRQ